MLNIGLGCIVAITDTQHMNAKKRERGGGGGGRGGGRGGERNKEEGDREVERGRKRKTKRWRVKESDRVRGAWVEGGG